MRKIIAIVEDDALLRGALQQLFEHAEGFALGPVCATAEELLERLPGQGGAIAVALIDLGLPGISGSELIARLRAGESGIACVAHTVMEEPEMVFAALRAGAAGYLLKGSTGAGLLHSLRELENGGAPLTPRIARLLIGEFQAEPRSPLSIREGEVLKALSLGCSYKEIAAELFVSVHTVHTHVKNIYEKLEARGRQDAVERARRKGWLS